jgi:hypothetical protein
MLPALPAESLGDILCKTIFRGTNLGSCGGRDRGERALNVTT